MKCYYNYTTPVGKIQITEDSGYITHILYRDFFSDGEENETLLIKETFSQLTEYFNGKRKQFEIPLKLNGTEFHKKVWNSLLTIPYGEVWTYKKLAESVNCENGFRAVGLANNRNPISIIVPCHRVIGSTGKLVGYAGGLDVKKFLLKLEFNNSKRPDELF